MLDLVGNSQYTCDSDIIYGGNDYIIRFVNNAVVMTTLSNDVLINKYEVAQGASIMIIDGTCIEITTKGMRRIFMFRFFGRINGMMATCVARDFHMILKLDEVENASETANEDEDVIEDVIKNEIKVKIEDDSEDVIENENEIKVKDYSEGKRDEKDGNYDKQESKIEGAVKKQPSWDKIAVKRKRGRSRGKFDYYYISPNGTKYRSHKMARKHGFANPN